MSSVKLKLPLGGSKTISAPDSASDETITLPAGNQTVATQSQVNGLGGRKNLIINGGMSVSQRGDYSTATSMTNGQYGVDRWKSEVKLVTATLTHTDNKIRYTATSTASGRLGPIQWVEFDNRFKGKEFTFSAYVKSNHSNVNLRIDDGVTVQYSSLYTGNATEAVERLSKTFTVASNATQLKLYAKIGSGGDTAMTTGDYIEIYDAQLELGSVATDFEHRSYGEELALCQRYYEVIPSYSLICVPDGSNSGVSRGTVQFKVEKRSVPTTSSFTFTHVNGGGFSSVSRTASNITTYGLAGVNYTTVNQFGSYNGFNSTNITVDAEL